MDQGRKDHTEVEVPRLLSKERKQSSQLDMVNSWVAKDFGRFSELLGRRSFDLEQGYDDFGGLRLIDLTAKVVGFEAYVKAILEAGGHCASINPATGRAALHYAVEAANLPVVQLLVAAGADVNVQDGEGDCPLHVVAKRWEGGRSATADCLRWLLDHADTQLNIPNTKGYTPIHMAAALGEADVVELLLTKGWLLDLDSYRVNSVHPTARAEIASSFPHLEDALGGCPEWGSHPSHAAATSRYRLFHLITNSQEIRFCQAFREAMKSELHRNALLRYDDGKLTYLQYASEKGLPKAAKMLLRHGADVNYAPGRSLCPVALACRQGHHEVLSVLLDSKDLAVGADESGATPLHLAVKCPANSAGHLACLQRLLRHAHLDANVQDAKGKTPLHFAVKYGNEKCVFELLDHGAYMDVADKFGETPLANISRSTLNKYFDSKISANEELPKDSDYAVLFDYRFLSPHTRRKHDLDEDPVYSFNTDLLAYLARSGELKALLAHPILSTVIFFKWHRIRMFFYLSLMFYTVFCTLLTVFVFFKDQGVVNNNLGGVNSSLIVMARVTEAVGAVELDDRASSTARVLLLGFLVVLGLAEVVQLATCRLQYFRNLENYLQCSVVVSTAVLLSVTTDSTLRPQLSAVCILLSWFEFFFTIGKHPRLIFHIDMFRTASGFLFRFLIVHTSLIVAFALSFHVLFRGAGDNPFKDAGQAFFKTTVMLTGEFDLNDIPLDAYPGTSHVIFALFIFLVAIVLFNLLIGLAVSATRPIEDDAFLYGCIAQVPIISYFENTFFSDNNPLKRCFHYVCMLECFYPNRKGTSKSQPIISVFPNQKNRMEVKYLKTGSEKSRYLTENRPVSLAYKLDSKIVQDSQYIITNQQDSAVGHSDRFEDIKGQLEACQAALEDEVRSCKAALIEILEKLEKQDQDGDPEHPGAMDRPRRKKKSDALLKKMKQYGASLDQLG